MYQDYVIQAQYAMNVVGSFKAPFHCRSARNRHPLGDFLKQKKEKFVVEFFTRNRSQVQLAWLAATIPWRCVREFLNSFEQNVTDISQ